jgi:hypothetical protein
MKFCFPAVPNAESYEIEVSGLAPGTEAQMAISATNSAGTGPRTNVPLVVPALAPTVPAAPVVAPGDETAGPSETPEAANSAQ